MELEIDKDLLSIYLKIFFLRSGVVFGCYMMFTDTLQAILLYKDLLKKPSANITKPAKISYCNMKQSWPTKEVNGMIGEMQFGLFLFIGFMAAIALIFLIQLVVNVRLIIFPIPPQTDPKGFPIISMWTKLKTKCYYLATLVGDLPLIAIAVYVYSIRRGTKGLGCWECYKSITCTRESDFTAILASSQLSMVIMYPAVVVMTFYKGFSAYYHWSNPGMCDCECKPARCCTGTFFAMIFTILMMTPGWMVLLNAYYAKEGIKPDSIQSLVQKTAMMGMIIWGVILFGICCMPLKMLLLRPEEKKK